MELVVHSDKPGKLAPAAQEMADFAGPILALTYPGYRWRVEPHPHPKDPFIDIRCEETASVRLLDTPYEFTDYRGRPIKAKRAIAANLGYTIKFRGFYSASSLKAEIIKAGGVVLELFELSRRARNLDDIVSRPRLGGLLIVPCY